MAVAMRRYRFTLEDYHRMGEVGILSEDDRVELIEGEIVEMSPIGRPHASTVDRLNMLFAARLAGRVIVRVQNPLTLPALASELRPDIQLLRHRADFYARSVPEVADVLLLIEVMDSSVAYDRRVKLPLYARAALAEVWLLNVDAEHIELHRNPTADHYRESRIVKRGETLAPVGFPELVLTLDDLLGPAASR